MTSHDDAEARAGRPSHRTARDSAVVDATTFVGSRGFPRPTTCGATRAGATSDAAADSGLR
jgi:hypothetical protein